MPISIDWQTKIITIPQTANLDVETFRNEVRALEASSQGVLYPRVISTARGLNTLSVTFVNNYRYQFEAGQYTVEVTGGLLNGELVFSPGVQVIKNVNESQAVFNISDRVLIESIKLLLEQGLKPEEITAIADGVWNKDICP